MPRNRFSTETIRTFAFAVILVGLSGCSAYEHTPFKPRLDPALGTMREDGVGVVDLLYATDRGVSLAPTNGDLYEARRSRELKLGRCEISIPLDHARGRCEEPGLFEPLDARRQVRVLKTSAAEPTDEFLSALDRRLAESERREILVFVHGYAVTFDQAATRFAQIAHDVEFDGVPILFSWPTQGSLLSYFIDGSNAEWSARYLSDFLAELVEHSGASRIHILAHSMGARVLTYAIRNLAADHPQLASEIFDQIILAAADIDAEIFERDFVRYYARLAKRVTMYVSTNDWALSGAQSLLGYSRLGVDGLAAENLDLYRKFDVIDATRVDRGIVGHIYYGSSPDVLVDLKRVLSGAPPEQGGLRRHFVYLLDPTSTATPQTRPAK